MDDDNQPLAILSQKKYDVFISFRGEDTRANITSHLHKALKDGGIETYFDEDKLERGEEISKALLEAIEDSKISIVVFSKDYASSKWCLGELAHILQCVKSKTHIVVTVFYQVDPTDVRKQKRSYAEAFEKHNKDHYDDATISKWRDALTTAANHSGWDVSNYSNEAQVVRDIFDFVREKLRSISPSHHYSKQGIVGIDDSIADLNNLLSNSARVGICGMGGLGKTTLAEVFYNQSCHQYDSHCFFQNVREEFQQNRRKLKEEFFGQLSNEKGLQYGHLGSLKDRLRHKKLLVVLDDVDDLDQYNCLLEDSHSWLNSESRLIITSRNHQVLRNIIGNDEGMIYNLKELKEEEALQLFCLHAFKSKSPKESYEQLSSMFVKYAKGLPLALKVLGSHLYSKSIQVWQSLLNNIQVNPDQEVTSKLKISFDGLDPKQQSIFLDIACFFRGETKYLARDILDDRGEFDSVIEVLIDRCLITKGHVLQMHDLLQEMGQSIACGSNYNKWLENYTRLWKVEDICRFFRRYKGPPTIEGIFHVDGDDFSRRNDHNVIKLDPLILEKVPKLRLLKLSGEFSLIRVQLPNGLHDMTFPDELRHLEWAEYPFESLGSNFTPQNLAYFRMEKSQLKELWKENQDVSNLKYVILSESKKLTCLPNLSQANLHQLCLNGCTSLVNLPPLTFYNILDDPDKEFIVMFHYNYWMVRFVNERDVQDTEWVRLLPSNLLDLSGCSNLTTLPEISDGTGIEVLPSSIENLVMLEILDLSGCKNLKSIPITIFNMGSISVIEIDKYPQLQILPYNGLPVEDSSETSTSQLLLTHDQPYICSSCTSTAILNLHYDGVDFTCCECFLFYTIRNILATQYFMDEIFFGKCREKDLIEAITPSSLHSGDSIEQSIESILPDLNLPATFLEDYDKCRDEKEKDLIEAITPSSLHSGDSIDQSIESILPDLNLPATFLEDYDKCRDENEKIPIPNIQQRVRSRDLINGGIPIVNSRQSFWHLSSTIIRIQDHIFRQIHLHSFLCFQTVNCLVRVLVLFQSASIVIPVRDPFFTPGRSQGDLSIIRFRSFSFLNENTMKVASVVILLILTPQSTSSSLQTRPRMVRMRDRLTFLLEQNLPIRQDLPTSISLSSQTSHPSSSTTFNLLDLIEAITPSSLHSGDSIDQSIESMILPYLNLPVTFLEDYDECRDEKEKDLSRPSFCYRGDTITQWFAHQSMGSSLQLNLPFSSPEYVNNFVGFGLCIVVEFEATTLKRDDVLKCEYNLETKSGQNFQFYSIMQYQKATHFDDDDDDDSNLDSSSNHQVFVWYLYRKDISMKRLISHISREGNELGCV
ncbi:hypothetical protein CsatB_015899 [Cannabis sativa]